jgi:hypothetical protein
MVGDQPVRSFKQEFVAKTFSRCRQLDHAAFMVSRD